MIRRAFVLVCIAALPLAAWGQLLANVKLEPQEIKPGASVKITVNFDVTGGINCGLRVHFGDGNTQDYKVNQKKDVPLVVTRQYAQAGEYRVKAEPKTIGLLGGCGGRNQETVLKVVAPPAPPPVAAAPAPAAQKTAVAASSTTTTSEVVLSELVGDWGNSELFLQIADDGSYQVLETPTSDPNDPLMGGFLARDGTNVIFVTNIYGECAGQTGVYEALMTDGQLILILVDDPCQFRATRFESPWDQV